MAFQREIGSGVNRATDYRDLLMKWVAMATSQHVATVVINNGGTGGTYVIGDVVTLTHAGAILDARFEVLTVSAGQILTMRIQDTGAFSNRVATISIGTDDGAGYSVGEIVEIQGGTSRELAKAIVDTVSTGNVTAISLFETGGSYSVAPSATDNATIGIGPSGFGGDDALEIDVDTMTGLIGTTGLAVTGGGGTGATVDITLAQTGWAVERNTNNRDENSLDDEKEVVMVGDAAGRTNKPYVGFLTWSVESGIDDRFGILCLGMTAHNPATALAAQIGLSPGLSVGDVLEANGTFLLCDENTAQEMDFWITANDQRVGGAININPAAGSTDDGEYMHWYAGYGNSFATEIEDPYPFAVGACARIHNVDPSSSSESITGLSECIGPSGQQAPMYFYRSEDSTWVNVENSEGLSANQVRDTIMAPMGQITRITGGTDADQIVGLGPVQFVGDDRPVEVGSTGRGAVAGRFLPTPGSASDLHRPIPLTIYSRPGGTTLNQTLDTVRLQLDGFFWVSASNAAAATIANFSEDFVTIGTTRYRVFHTQIHNQTYHYICIEEDVG